jgi:XTP/dITP diphosphohydrolase
MKLILASNNRKKIAEIASLLPGVDVQTMGEIGYAQPIEEPYDTFRENAHVKAQTIYDFCGLPVLSDDSGLCVDALGGRPGVYSARFAGPGATDAVNNQKLLDELRHAASRKAHYIAVLCLIVGGRPHYFEGRCDGTIAFAPAGSGGFGYDPIFIPDGYDRTFGEIDPAIKSRISHRAKALSALLESGLPA